jgi:hypothetical protein
MITVSKKKIELFVRYNKILILHIVSKSIKNRKTVVNYNLFYLLVTVNNLGDYEWSDIMEFVQDLTCIKTNHYIVLSYRYFLNSVQ